MNSLDPPSKAALIVVHWCRPEECLASVEAFRSQNVMLKITVVDNGSPARDFKRLSESLSDVHLIRLEKNIGFGPAMNVGLRWWLSESNTEWAFLAPHDALPQPDCLERLLSVCVNRPGAGVACAEYGRAEVPHFSWLRGHVVAPAAPGSGWQTVAYPNGTLMLVRRQCVVDAGLFDERYFAYGEEFELGSRAKRAGWGVGVVWGAKVRNPIRHASSKVTWYLGLRNNMLAAYQHRGIGAAAIRVLISLGRAGYDLLARSSNPDRIPPHVRLRATMDFVFGRFGPPPNNL